MTTFNLATIQRLMAQLDQSAEAPTIIMHGARTKGHVVEKAKAKVGKIVTRGKQVFVRNRRGIDDSSVGVICRDDKYAVFQVKDLDESVPFQWISLDRESPADIEQKPAANPEPAKARVVSGNVEDLAPLPGTVSLTGDNVRASRNASDLIKRMRAIRGLSQSQLAKRMGIAPSRIVELEAGNGPQGPTVDMLARIATACEVTLSLGFSLPEFAGAHV
jgi:DNA-binding XRE family transcriptional regulator